MSSGHACSTVGFSRAAGSRRCSTASLRGRAGTAGRSRSSSSRWSEQLLPRPKGRVERAVTKAIQDRLRTEDSAGHLGGLRFAVLAPESDAAGAASIAGNVQKVVGSEVETLGYEPSQYEVAVGWAVYPDDADSRPGLLSQAQNNLEAAVTRTRPRPDAD